MGGQNFRMGEFGGVPGEEVLSCTKGNDKWDEKATGLDEVTGWGVSKNGKRSEDILVEKNVHLAFEG